MSNNLNTEEEFYGEHYKHMESVKDNAIVLANIAVSLAGSTGARIISRIKSPESMIQKIKSDGFAVNHRSALLLESDAIGIRIITSTLSDVYAIEDRIGFLVDKTSNARIIKRKDFIKSPKASGYRSLHIILEIKSDDPDFEKMKVEIQIRTAVMDCWASLEHIVKYKQVINITPEIYETLHCYQEEAEKEISNLKLS